ncbi:MAG TPA: fumarylacetoacetate hydrolase family protein [Euzebyales bacterium]|nr:fumarylacetoacetate hydrolase family protein [Euzebyales bacterium]
MRFVQYRSAEGRPRVALVPPGGDIIVDLGRACAETGHAAHDGATGCPVTMLDVIGMGDAGLGLARAAGEGHGSWPDAVHAVDGVRLAPPVHGCLDVYCVGVNYVDHSAEFQGEDADLPQTPIIFTKTAGSIIGPGDDILIPAALSDEVDYEAELAVVLAAGGRNIAREDVREHVFGVTALNDVTARNLQRAHQQWLLGKSLDTFCPIGPALVHVSAFAWPLELDIACDVNGERRQRSNTRHLLFDVPELVSTISRGRTLRAGDIIATGTPQGVGMGFRPPRFLRPGDVVTVEIEGVGRLENPCVHA